MLDIGSGAGLSLQVLAVEVGVRVQIVGIDRGARIVVHKPPTVGFDAASVMRRVRSGGRVAVIQPGRPTGWARRLTRFATGVFVGGGVGAPFPRWQALVKSGVDAPSVDSGAAHVPVHVSGGPEPTTGPR